jgi:hypothetical protein
MKQTFKKLLVVAITVGALPFAGCSSGSATSSVSGSAESLNSLDDGETLLQKYPPYSLDPYGVTETVEVKVEGLEDGRRQFTLSSTQQQRDDKPQQRVVIEQNGSPNVHSGNLLFDALFAQAVDDLHQASVSVIKDGSYNGGKAIPCECFETGEKWAYVWTRDLSYAADLGLVYFAPQRVVNSLVFKTSDFRSTVQPPEQLPDGSLQIIQDTGSGGSWPVSTDRVVWAIAAESAIENLQGAVREQFMDHAYAALRGTVEADRIVAFDSRSQLYGGEQSYLDWRVQTYAPWIINNLSRMAESKALSTNVAHFQAISLAADLADRKEDSSTATKYRRWASDLKEAINNTFWLEDVGLYSSLTTSAEDPVALHKYDMLGTALAIRYGIASDEQARRAMANYPHSEFGVPVYYPHQPDMYVYHNRALWPFVAGYALRAGVDVQNPKVVNNAIHSLMRGAALHLSNMENLEWLTGKSWYDDGPAINSRRQLWSVGAYLGMVTETFFGYHTTRDGIRITPFLTAEARQLLGDTEQAVLNNLVYKDKNLSVKLQLPPKSEVEGYYPVTKVSLNGSAVEGVITERQLTGNNVITIEFADIKPMDEKITMAAKVDPLSHNDPRVFSPAAPRVEAIAVKDGRLFLEFNDAANSAVATDGITYNIYRDGEMVVSNTRTNFWHEPNVLPLDQRYCYAVEAVFTASGNRSHHSEPYCYDEQAVTWIPVTDERVKSNLEVTPPSAPLTQSALVEWGAPSDWLSVADITVDQPGQYVLQILYNNRQHTIDSGVTAAVKQVVLFDSETDAEVSRGTIEMPNVEDRDEVYPLRLSTELPLQLDAGSYYFKLLDFFNMSYLEANKTYTGKGGLDGAVNTSTIAAFKLTRVGD